MYSFVKYIFPLLFTNNIHIEANNFAYEYFRYKGVSRVTIFSCEQSENDFSFVRKMNELGISVAVNHPNSKFYNVSNEVLRKDNWSFGLFLDTTCQNRETNEKIMTQTAKHRLYDGIHVWLILGSNFEETIHLLNDTVYGLATDLVIGVATEIGYDLHDVYNPCKICGGALNVTTLGFWDRNKGFNITLTQPKFIRRYNLHGMKIRVASIVKYQPPGMKIEEHLQDYTAKSKDSISKYGYAILQTLADLFNFTMELQAVGEWIATINGTEEGMMPTLYKAEADIGGTPASVITRYLRKPHGRLLMPGYPFRTFFILRSNEKKLKWTELLTPFATNSWYATVLTGLLSVLIITTIQMSEYGEGWFQEMGHAIFATLGATCQQGLTFVPNRLAGRIAFLFLLLLGVLLSNYYSASVVSVRLSQPPDKMNDSLYSLAKSHVTVASETFRNIDDFLESRGLIEWEVRYFKEKVWDKLSSSRYVDPEIGLARVTEGGYAYHCSAEVAYHYIDLHWDDEAICDIAEVHVVTPRIMSFWERNDSPFNEIMKIGLIKTSNVGIRMRTVKKWRPKKPYCSPDAQSLQSITFFDIAPAVLMILTGVVLASAICCVETIVHKLSPDTSDAPIQKKKHRIVGKKTLQRN